MIRHLGCLSAIILLSACTTNLPSQGAGQGTIPTTPTTPGTPPSTPELPHLPGGISNATPLRIASQINVVTAQSQSKRMSRAVRHLLNALSGTSKDNILAFDDENTDYTKDVANFNVHIDALEPLDEANMILCYMSQLGASDPSTMNAGNYLALVDPTKCQKGNESNSGNGQSSVGATVQRDRIVVNNSRVDNNSPQIVHIWTMGGQGQEIRGEMTVTAGSADAPPFGLFTFNWVQVADDPTHPVTKGSLIVFNRDPDTGGPLTNGNVGLTLYTEELRDFTHCKDCKDGVNPRDVFGSTAILAKAASAVMQTDNAGNVQTGIALTQMKVLDPNSHEVFDIDAILSNLHIDPSTFATGQYSNTFAVAYNADNLLMQKAHLYEQLPYVQDSDHSGYGTCLSRQEFDEAVWCYNLYESSTGKRVELDSGFPFTLQKDACGSSALFGNLSYYGAWFEGDQMHIDGCTLEDGDIVTRQSFNNSTPEHYEIVKSTGHLVKNTVLKMPLSSLRGIRLDLNQLPNQQGMFHDPNIGDGPDPYAALTALQEGGHYQIDNWVAHYMTHDADHVSTDGFYIYGFLSNGNSGPTITTLASILSKTPSLEALYDVTPRSVEGQQIWFYSQQLGGSVMYTKDQTSITYNKQEIVDPNDTLFANSDNPASLLCLFGCLKAGITADDQSTPNGPMLSDEAYTTVNSNLRYVPYQVSRTDLRLKNMSSQDIKLATDVQSTGMFSWGISMAPLVTQSQLDALTNWWEIWSTEGAVFYRWETGSNSWNVSISARKEGTASFVSFDKPIQFSYTHATENDRASNSTYDGQTYLLSYQGSCQLQGIPDVNIGGNNSRYYPVFGIKDGTIMGDNDEYVIKALQGEQKPQEVSGQCSLLAASDPAVGLPTQVSGTPTNYATDMPEVEVATVDNGNIVGH